MSGAAHQAGPVTAGGLNPETLENLRLARASQAFFPSTIQKPELWELYELSHADRWLLRRWIKARVLRAERDSTGEAGGAVVDALEALRKREGGWAGKMRLFFATLPELPTDWDTVEIALALLAVSGQARESAAQWMANPMANREASSRVMGRIFKVAESYRKVMGSSGPKPPPVASAAESDQPSPTTRILPRGVNLETLEDLGRVEDCRNVLREFDPEVQLWECFCLVMRDEVSRYMIDDLIRRKKCGPPQSFALGAQGLFDRLQDIREENGDFVRALAAFVGDLPVGSYATETRELALAFIVASPAGRERGAQWLRDPAFHRQEAATRFEGIIGRAMNYQTALRTLSEPQPLT